MSANRLMFRNVPKTFFLSVFITFFLRNIKAFIISKKQFVILIKNVVPNSVMQIEMGLYLKCHSCMK